MALKKFERRQVPIDGTMFRTKVNLGSVIYAADRSAVVSALPAFVGCTWLPAWVHMAQYQAQKTTLNPTGIRWGPVVCLGDADSPTISLHSNNHAAGLHHDWDLLGDNIDGSRAFYCPLEGEEAPGHDVSIYECDICKQSLYADPLSLRSHKSAMLQGVDLVCRDCEATGLVTDADSLGQLDRCKALAKFLGGDSERSLDRSLGFLSGATSFGSASQSRLWKSDKWSFDFLISYITPGQPARRCMNGGLIQHGPTPILGDDGAYTFRQWDYSEKRERDATPEEIGHISWSTHT